jgi:hypothetical protein
MGRAFVWLVVATMACTPAQAPAARKLGEVMAVSGVAGLTGSAAAMRVTDVHELVYGFSAISAAGIITFAISELSQPPGARRETIPERNRRWAKILTERAQGAARDGRCPRVRRLEPKVAGYDAEIHDLVFMRDPEIVKCLSAAAPTAPIPADTPLTSPVPLVPTQHPPDETPQAP